MPKTRDAFALRGLYDDFDRWEDEVYKVLRKVPPPSSEKHEAYKAKLKIVCKSWVDVISNYLEHFLPKYEIRAVKSVEEECNELAKYFNFVRPRIEVEFGEQVLKRIERHIGRLRAYSQKILADVLEQGFSETLRAKGNRVRELIINYEFLAEFFKNFRKAVQERRDQANEKFQKEFRLEFGRRLKQARKAAKLTQQELAESVGLKTFNAIAQYERGISDPSLPTLYRISKILNCSADWLLGLQ